MWIELFYFFWLECSEDKNFDPAAQPTLPYKKSSEHKEFVMLYEEGKAPEDGDRTSTDASSSAATSKQSSAQKSLPSKFHWVPAGVNILQEGETTAVGLVVAKGVQRGTFLQLAEQNVHLNEL